MGGGMAASQECWDPGSRLSALPAVSFSLLQPNTTGPSGRQRVHPAPGSRSSRPWLGDPVGLGATRVWTLFAEDHVGSQDTEPQAHPGLDNQPAHKHCSPPAT